MADRRSLTRPARRRASAGGGAASRSRPSRTAALLAALLAAACSHGEPWHLTAVPDNPPLPAVSFGDRLTTNPASDEAPTWLPDGTQLIFSWQLPEHTDSDRCLGFLSLTTHRIGRTICPGPPVNDRQADGARASAISPGGRLAWVRETGLPQLPPSQRFLMVGPLDGSAPATQVLAFPHTAPGGLLHVQPLRLAWRGDSTLLYLATQIYTDSTGARYPAPLEIGVVSFAGGTVTAGVVPNTASATSVAVDPQTGTVYTTFVGDPLVYALDITTGQRTPVADFSALLGFPRQITVSRGRVVAVVQGRATVVAASYYGVTTIADEGGELGVATLGTPTAQLVRSPVLYWFRAPALSPGGDSIAVEVYPLDVHARFPGVANSPIDTVTSRVSDLWMVTFP